MIELQRTREVHDTRREFQAATPTQVHRRRRTAQGDFDLAAEPRLASLLDHCTTRAALVLVDLSAVEFLSCGALRLLLIASRRTRAQGGRFVLIRGQAAVQRLFEIVGVGLRVRARRCAA